MRNICPLTLTLTLTRTRTARRGHTANAYTEEEYDQRKEGAGPSPFLPGFSSEIVV